MKKNLNKVLFSISKISGWILLFLLFLYFLSGYGMTKGIIDYSTSQKLHNSILPLSFLFFLILHIFFPVKVFLLKFIKDERWINIYLIILFSIIYLLFLYFHFYY